MNLLSCLRITVEGRKVLLRSLPGDDSGSVMVL